MTHPRTDDRDAEFIRRWNAGEPMHSIAKTMMMGKSAAYDLRVALNLGDRALGKNVWSSTELADVRDRWAKGESAAIIARHHPNRTRAAVIGIVHRNGWQHLGRGTVAAPARAPKVARSHIKPPKPEPGAVFGVLSQSKSSANAQVRQERAAEGQEIIASVERTTVASPNATPFLQARDGCKWPIGEGLGMLSCCNRIHRGVYCEGHSRIAFALQQPPQRDRSDRAASSFSRHDRVAVPRPKAANTDSLWDQVA